MDNKVKIEVSGYCYYLEREHFVDCWFFELFLPGTNKPKYKYDTHKCEYREECEMFNDCNIHNHAKKKAKDLSN